MSQQLPILEVNDLKQYYPSGRTGLKGPVVRAVDGVSFELFRGETLSLVGESGCGKSTVGRSVLGLVKATSGSIILDGQRIGMGRMPLAMRRRMQIIFQDPFSSLNPRMRVGDAIAEPLANLGVPSDVRKRRVAELLNRVGLNPDYAKRYPHEFSGGQRQRIGIARALAPEPEVIICDEATSALDVSVKAQIINLLQDLQHDLGLALLFISHDLAVVEHLTQRIAVMYLGQIVESGPKRAIFTRPRHPYTTALLSAVPVPDPRAARSRIMLKGDVPSPLFPPSGCRFHTRCPWVFDRCKVEVPALKPVADGQLSACHLNDQPDSQNPLLRGYDNVAPL